MTQEKHNDVTVVDNYFPDWMVEKIANYISTFPVTYTNSSEFDYTNTRFFGNMLIDMDRWVVPMEKFWFVDYFNLCMINDLLKEYNIEHCRRMLLNAQVPGLGGCNHQDDSETDDNLSVIYHACGNSGDTVFVTPEGEETQRVSFKEGRIVIFNSRLWHRGDAPDQGLRMSLGCMYPLVPVVGLHNPW